MPDIQTLFLNLETSIPFYPSRRKDNEESISWIAATKSPVTICARRWKLSEQFCEVPCDRNTRSIIGTAPSRVPIANIPGYRNFCDTTLTRSGFRISWAPPHRIHAENCRPGLYHLVQLLWNVRIRFRGQLHIPAVCGYTLWLLRYSRPLGGRPSLKYGDSGHRQRIPPVRDTAISPRRSLLPSFSIPSLQRNSVFPFSYSFPRVLVHVHVRRSVATVKRWAHPPYTAVFHIIYNPRPARCPRNNSVRIRERASVSPNWWKPYENVVTCPCDNSEWCSSTRIRRTDVRERREIWLHDNSLELILTILMWREDTL